MKKFQKLLNKRRKKDPPVEEKSRSNRLKRFQLEGTGLPRKYWKATIAKVPEDVAYGKIVRRYIEKMDLMIPRGKGLLLWGPNRRGKCVDPETLVMWNGRLQEIGRVYEGALSSVPVRGTVGSHRGENAAKSFYDDGIQRVLRLQTNSGFELVGTFDHPVLVRRGEQLEQVPMGKVNVRDDVVIEVRDMLGEGKTVKLRGYFSARGVKDICLPRRLDEHLAEMYGWILGEGHIHGNHVTVTQKITKPLERLSELYWELFEDHGSLRRTQSVWTFQISSAAVADFFSKMGCGGVSKEKKIVSELVFSPRRVVIAFLKAFFDAEGSVGECVEISSASEQIMRSVQLLLCVLGIFSRRVKVRKSATNGKNIKRDYWMLSIRGGDLETFQEKVGFGDGKKARKLKKRIRDKSAVDYAVIDGVEGLARSARRELCDWLGTGRGNDRDGSSDGAAREYRGNQKVC